ncbi:hypothetical protein FOA52_010185 [Chlamydomonas sp. UWO 241]|nr:hypothetical protein FOA52_010185 [Chlamydomonas sp. UWO 241]
MAPKEPKTAAVVASKAPAKKVVAKKEAGGKKKKSKKSVETYKIYLYKVLKQVHPDTGVSSKAMSILNSMMNDMFDKVATEASRLSRYTKKHSTWTLLQSKQPPPLPKSSTQRRAIITTATAACCCPPPRALDRPKLVFFNTTNSTHFG